MEHNPHDPLEALLRDRYLEPPSASLAARITAAARTRPQQEPEQLWPWLARLFGECFLPRPAITAAVVLLIGMAAGAGLPSVTPHEADPMAEIIFDEGVIQ